MLKRTLLLLVFVSGFSLALSSNAVASNTIVGRIADYSATSLSVRGTEIVTVTLDSRTTYTKWITQKPWGEDTRLTAAALGLGRLVTVHRGKDDGNVAEWIQIATDMRPVTPAAAPSFTFSPPQAEASARTTAKSKSSDVLTSKQVKELIATAKTPADHLKLQRHFLAVEAKYDAEAAEHAGLAQAYRKPHVGRLMPGDYTKKAEHCDRLTQSLRDAAKEARELASDHGEMASTK